VPDLDDFMTVAEIASILKLNQQTVRNRIDAVTMPAVRIGRRVRIKRSDLDRFVEASYRGAKPARLAGRPGRRGPAALRNIATATRQGPPTDSLVDGPCLQESNFGRARAHSRIEISPRSSQKLVETLPKNPHELGRIV
jgi:excisionase family DNA binding protein